MIDAGAVEVVVRLEAEEQVSRDVEHVFDDERVFYGDASLVVHYLADHHASYTQTFGQFGLREFYAIERHLDKFSGRERSLNAGIGCSFRGERSGSASEIFL